MSPTPADLRARLAAAHDIADRSAPPGDWPTLTRLEGAPVPPGYWMWRIGPDGGPVTALPALVPSAPVEVRRRYLVRVVANGTGRCPMCGAVEGIDGPDPAGYRAGVVTVRLVHATGCPCLFTDNDRQWFDPRSVQ